MGLGGIRDGVGAGEVLMLLCGLRTPSGVSLDWEQRCELLLNYCAPKVRAESACAKRISGSLTRRRLREGGVVG